MNATDLPSVTLALSPVVIWLIALWLRGFDNPRVIVALVAWTAIWYGAGGLLPPTMERAVRALLVLGFLAGVLWPERLGLLSVGGSEAAADRLFRRISRWLRAGGGDPETATSFAARLAPGEFPSSRNDWLVAAALFRRSLLRSADPNVAPFVPAKAYERAARSFWRAGLNHGLIGRRHHPSAWDEGVALRCYAEEFSAAASLHLPAGRPLVALGGWDEEAERVASSLRDVQFFNPSIREARDSLVDAMTDSLTLARGDRSSEATARQHASAEQMNRQWAALAAQGA